MIIGFIAERYLADAMPFIVLAALPGWHYLIQRAFGQGAATARRGGATRAWRGGRSLVVGLFTALALFEVWTVFSLSLFYQRELGPVVTIPQRAGMVAFQQQVNRSLVGGPPPDVRFVPALPAQASALDLAVVGHCAAVYQYDGNGWHVVELGREGGAILLDVNFPHRYRGRRQPLVVTGGAHPSDVLAVTWEGGDRYRFSYLFDGLGGTWYTEQAVTVPQGSHPVQVDLVTGLGQVYVTVSGSPVFSVLYPVAAPTVVRLGSAPAGIPTTRVFAGEIRSLPVPTPICDELERQR